MSTTTKPTPEQARAARAHRVSMLRNRAMAGVIATFVLALGTVGFTGQMGAQDSASSGTNAALVDGSSSSTSSGTSSATTDDSTTTSTWSDDDSSDVAPMTTGQS